MSDVSFSQGPPETVLDPEPDEVHAALAAAGDRDDVAVVAARSPRSLEAWARLGELGRDDIEAYAYFRVGYHRGLDEMWIRDPDGLTIVVVQVPEDHPLRRRP